MLVRLLSDLHHEHRGFVYENKGEDIIILGGDIHGGCRHHQLLDTMPDNIPILFVAGNHEYYNDSFEAVNTYLKEIESFKPNFLFLNNSSFEYKGISFFGGTMWTDFKLYGLTSSKNTIYNCEMSINDFRLIQYKEVRFNTTDCINEYEKFNKAFDDWINSSTSDTNICISHFLPSTRSVAPEYGTSQINAYFSSNQDDRIEKVDYWFHGHTHKACDYMIGDSRVVCNPRGYPGESNTGFNPDLIIEIP